MLQSIIWHHKPKITINIDGFLSSSVTDTDIGIDDGPRMRT